MLKFISGIFFVWPLFCHSGPSMEELFSIIKSGSAEKLEQLIAEGKINQFKKEDINSLLFYSARYNPSIEAIKAFVGAGGDVLLREGGGQSPLHVSARFNPNPKVTLAILEAGGWRHIDIKDTYWLSPLHHAAESNPNPKMIRGLANAGANVHALNRHQSTPLHYSAQDNPHPEVSLALIEAGADIHAQNRNGSSPLHLAVATNPNVQVIIALLKAGADPQAKNRFGKTPSYYLTRRRDSPLDANDPDIREWKQALLLFQQKPSSHSSKKAQEKQPTFKSKTAKELKNAGKSLCQSSFS